MLHIGFDIGGTNIKAGVVTEKGRLIVRRRIPFPKGESYKKVAELMAGLVREMGKDLEKPPREFGSLGIAVPGELDREGTTVVNAYNLHFHNVPLKEAMENHFPTTPVYLANDANAAVLAEQQAGALRGYRNAVLMTLGTGVGGGILLNGKLFNGGMGHGVELGHMTILHDGPLCTCGRKGCIESVCTTTWLKQQGRKSIIEYPLSLIHQKVDGNMDSVTAKTVIDAAKEGDAVALDIFERYVEYLSSALASVTAILDPEIIALGGGVSLAGNFLYDPLRKKVKEKSFFRQSCKIVPAVLGNNAGTIGAALLRGQNKQGPIKKI